MKTACSAEQAVLLYLDVSSETCFKKIMSSLILAASALITKVEKHKTTTSVMANNARLFFIF
jgi:hypothetical protein